MKIQTQTIIQRVTHWLSVLAFVGLFVTEIINQYFFSKEAILRSFEFSFAAVGLQDVPMTDRLFIAKLLRREVWAWHFWFGVCFVTLTLFRIALAVYFKNYKNIWFQGVMAFIVLIMFSTGYPLWARAFENIDQNYQDLSRQVHHYAVYVLWAAVAAHVSHRIFLRNKNTGEFHG